MKETLEHGDFEALKGLPVAELKRRWRQQAGAKAKGREPPLVRALLVRDLAWWAQQRAHGGLDAESQGLLNAAIRQAKDRSAESGDNPAPNPRKPPKRRSKKLGLQSGVTLVREWRGKTYKVKVVEDAKGKQRYTFAGREYRSLTVIAQEITGAHWSGPRFFGLNRPRKLPPE